MRPLAYSPLRLTRLLLLAALLAPAARAEKVIPLAADGATVYADTTGLCPGCTITDEQHVIDADLTNYATIFVPLGVDASAYLGVRFPGDQPAAGRAGFVLTSAAGPLDLDLLGGLTLSTYLDGAPQETSAGAAALRVGLLGPGRGFVFFRPALPFDELRLTLDGAALAPRELRVEYAVRRVGERPFVAAEALAADGATAYGGTAGACVGCEASAPERAIDDEAGSAARLRVPLGVSGSAHLGVVLPAEVDAGGRVGFRIREDAGLLDGQLAPTLRITTYLDGAQQESADAGGALELAVGDGSNRKQNVHFQTSLPFDEVRLTVGGLATADIDVRVYAAYTARRADVPGIDGLMDDVPAGLQAALLGLDLEEALAATGGADAEPTAASTPATAAVASGTADAGVSLTAPWPNPARSSARLALTVGAAQHVRVAVYDATGRLVAVLHDGVVSPGAVQPLELDGSALPSGVYVVRAEGAASAPARRLTLAR
jgi:hypothetical protein